jgi:hypothetical protein
MAGSTSQTDISGLTAKKTKKLINPITSLKPTLLQLTPVLNTGPNPGSQAVPFTGPTLNFHGLPTTYLDRIDYWPNVRDHRTNIIESTIIRATGQGGGYRGQVLERDPDGGTNGPIESVRITFESEDGTLQRTVQSDANGRYQVDLPIGRYVVSAHRYGYEDYTTRPGYFVRTGTNYQTGNLFLVRIEDEMDLWESMQLLAFVCRPVPKSPDPDPDSELVWSLS